jgi:hypothetical protein
MLFPFSKRPSNLTATRKQANSLVRVGSAWSCYGLGDSHADCLRNLVRCRPTHRSEVQHADHAAQTMGLEEHRRERPVACPTTNSPPATALGYSSPNSARTSSWDLFLSSICTLRRFVAGAYIQYHSMTSFSVPIRPSIRVWMADEQ